MAPRIDAANPGCPPFFLDHFGSPRFRRDRRKPTIIMDARPITSHAISNILSTVSHIVFTVAHQDLGQALFKAVKSL